MKRMKHRSGVVRSGCSENESCSIVLYFLEFRKKILRTAHLSITLIFSVSLCCVRYYCRLLTGPTVSLSCCSENMTFGFFVFCVCYWEFCLLFVVVLFCVFVWLLLLCVVVVVGLLLLLLWFVWFVL